MEDAKRDVHMNTAEPFGQRPVVGGIYHDKSGRSLVVLSIIDDKVLLEYASGTVSTIEVNMGQKLQPQIAVY